MGTKIVSKIRKRDGRIVKFNKKKIADAIFKAAASIGGSDYKLAERLADKVTKVLNKKYDGHTIPSVEEIQDIVERVLMEEGHARTAKAYILYRQRRKELREAKSLLGVKDDIKLSYNAIKVLERRYLKKDENGQIAETPSQMFHRVAENIAQADLIYKPKDVKAAKESEKEFYDMIANLEFMPNSPTLMNAGRELQQLSACFVLPVEDSIESIFEALKDTALIHQSGGGTGFSFSKLRPKNDVVKSTGGVASGPLSFMQVFDSATDVVKQGGRRRGANMGILRVDHPDILDFITAKEKTDVLTNFNISVGITEDFMKAVEEDKEYELINPHSKKVVKKLNARAVFELIVMMSWKNGEPGIIFLDRINKDNPTPKQGEIESTNPCITGDTLVSTSRGLLRMGEIAETYASGGLDITTDMRVSSIVESNGMLFLRSFETGVQLNAISKAWFTGFKDVFRLVSKSGYELNATADHKILTTDGWIKLKDIKPGRHKVLLQCNEGYFSRDSSLPFKVENEFRGENGRQYKHNFPDKWSRELGQVLGWLVGDGWLRDNDSNCRVGFSFGREDKKVFNHLKPILDCMYARRVKEIVRTRDVIHLSYHSKYFVEYFKKLGVRNARAENKVVPESIYTATEEAVIGFLQGLFTSDGTVMYHPSNKNYYIRLTSKSRRLLQGVQLLLLNMGVKSRIYDRSRKSRSGFEYETISGEKRKYLLDGVCFELNISRDMIPVFQKKVGFMCGKHKKKMKVFRSVAFHKTLFVDEVASIIPVGMKGVYDLTEPESHSFIANGFVIANCGEQPLLPYEACNLGSINLAKMVKEGRMDYSKLRKTVRTSIRFLDNVIDMSKFPLDKIASMVRKNRKIGLGVMGFADMLIRLGIQYNSEEALKTAEEVMKFIRDEGRKMSCEIAMERGVFPNFKDSIYNGTDLKLRNATITTIAPTGTISIISNCSSGIEPLFAISYIRNIMDNTELLEVNPLFEEIAQRRGFYSEELMKRIARKGSIQDIEEIPLDVRKIFVTSHDITPDWHLKMQAVFQKYTDNAVSKTVNFPSDATPKDIEEVFMLAYRLGCKGVTVYRDKSREQQVLNIESVNKIAVEKPAEQKPKTAEYKVSKSELKKSGKCPECKATLEFVEGCAKCPNCGYSVCSV